MADIGESIFMRECPHCGRKVRPIISAYVKEEMAGTVLIRVLVSCPDEDCQALLDSEEAWLPLGGI